MLDLTRVRRDLDSPVYGAMSHVVDVLMRVTHACEAVAVVRDRSNGRETVYAACRSGRSETPRYNTLRKWPGDPRSLFWRESEAAPTDVARLLKPKDTADAAVCREVAREMAAPELSEDNRCMIVQLSCRPACRALFVRLAPRPPFEDRATESIMRFAAKANHVLQQSLSRGKAPAAVQSPPMQIAPETVDISQLLDQLSGTEHRVLQRLRLNETERQVAKSLGRSPNTVHVHVKSIYRKLRVTSRKQLLLALADVSVPAAQPFSDTPNHLSKSA